MHPALETAAGLGDCEQGVCCFGYEGVDLAAGGGGEALCVWGEEEKQGGEERFDGELAQD